MAHLAFLETMTELARQATAVLNPEVKRFLSAQFRIPHLFSTSEPGEHQDHWNI